jgi:LysM domain
MRKAREFVDEYRRKGYPDERIRIIASMRPEPLRTEALKILDSEPAAAPEAEAEPVAAQEKPEVAAEEAESPVAQEVVEDSAPEAPQAAVSEDETLVVEEKAPEPVKVEAKPTEKKSSKKPTEEKSKVFDAMRKETSALRKERDTLKKQVGQKGEALAKLEIKVKSLEGQTEDIDKLRQAAAQAETLKEQVTELDALREQSAQLGAIQQELDEVRNQREDVTRNKAILENRVSDLESSIARKETLLTEKTHIIASMQDDLALERTERAQAANHLGELQELADRQTDRLAELGGIDEQLADASDSLERLRADADDVQAREQENVQRIGLLEENLNGARTDADVLRSQIKTNEDALDMLQRKLNAREAEFDSLRDHFEKEATDLQKQAEQEMWAIRRKLGMFKGISAASGALAAVFMFVLLVSLLFSGGEGVSDAQMAEAVKAMEDQKNAEIADYRRENNALSAQVAAFKDSASGREVVHNGGTGERRVTPRIVDVNIRNVRYHTLKKGDNPWKLGVKYYGDGTKGAKILAANPNVNPNNLKIGTRLIIPK